MQFGAISIAIGGLYLLERMVDEHDRDARDEMERLRDDVRDSAREYAIYMKALNLYADSIHGEESLKSHTPISHDRGDHDLSLNWAGILSESLNLDGGA
jgi:hypothetical protein